MATLLLFVLAISQAWAASGSSTKQRRIKLQQWRRLPDDLGTGSGNQQRSNVFSSLQRSH
jgi:hypothetical protein